MKMFVNTLLTLSSLLVKTIVVLLTIIVLTPSAYFAWRAGRPMSMPEFHGLSYYKLLAERRQAYDRLAHSYQASHPNTNVERGICFGSELVMIAYNLPWAGYCTFAGLAPGLKIPIGSNARRLSCGQNAGRRLNVLENWWDMYENFTYDLMSHIVIGAVPYCRIASP